MACILVGSSVCAQSDSGGSEDVSHEFYFTRGIYGGDGGGEDWGPRWAIDFPEADEHFLVALRLGQSQCCGP